MKAPETGNVHIVALLGVCFFLFPFVTFAQTDSLSVTVTPPLIQLTIGPGENWGSALKVVNSNSYEVAYYAQVVNFEPDGEGGASRFTPVLEGDTAHTLASWVTLSSEPVIVPAGQSGEVPFIVSIPADASPGGHYAAILVGTQPGKAKGAGASLSISSFVSSLLFVRIQGEVEEAGRIREFRSTKAHYETSHADFILRFENTGNTHLRPQGNIVLYNMWGKERGKLLINQTSTLGNVLPQSTRRFEFSWDGEQSVFDIGRYSAEVTLAYGEDSKKNVSATAFFWVIPTVPVALALGCVLAFLILTTWFIRRYIRRALTLERQRYGFTDTLPVASTPSLHTLVEPLKEGAIDLRSLMSKGKGESKTLQSAGSGLSARTREVPRLSVTQFIAKYKMFFLFVFFALSAIACAWVYLDNVLESDRQFFITDITVHEEE